MARIGKVGWDELDSIQVVLRPGSTVCNDEHLVGLVSAVMEQMVCKKENFHLHRCRRDKNVPVFMRWPDPWTMDWIWLVDR